MAYVSTFWRISFLFTVNLTDEVAQTGVTMAQPLPLGLVDPPTNEQVDDMGDAFADLLATAELTRGDYSRFVGVKAALVGTDGDYIAEPVLRTRTATAPTGSQVLPQDTVVLSLRSGQTLGKGNYGRMYIPHSRIQLNDGTPRTIPSYSLAVAQAGADFIAAMNLIGGGAAGDPSVRIMSQVAGIEGNKPVLSVGCGRVNDTQRRRRNALLEEYQFAPVE